MAAAVIAQAVAEVFGGVTDLLLARSDAKYGRLPDWLSPRDFQRRDYKLEIVLGGVILAIIIVIIAIVMIARKK